MTAPSPNPTPAGGEDELRRQLLLLLTTPGTDSEECYVDTKAKFLIDDLVLFIAAQTTEAYKRGFIAGGLSREAK